MDWNPARGTGPASGPKMKDFALPRSGDGHIRLKTRGGREASGQGSGAGGRGIRFDDWRAHANPKPCAITQTAASRRFEGVDRIRGREPFDAAHIRRLVV